MLLLLLTLVQVVSSLCFVLGADMHQYLGRWVHVTWHILGTCDSTNTLRYCCLTKV